MTTELWEISEDMAKDIWAITVSTAKEVLAEEQRNGFTKNPRTIVDNRKYDAPPEAVKPYGKIEFLEKIDIWELVNFILQQVEARSPVKDGDYKHEHIILVNGEQVMGAQPVIGPNDKVQIVNIAPYARKIERGLSKQAPKGVYRVVYNLARRRYNKLAFIKYTFVPLNLGVTTTGHKGKRVALRYPCIQITPSNGTELS